MTVSKKIYSTDGAGNVEVLCGVRAEWGLVCGDGVEACKNMWGCVQVSISMQNYLRVIVALISPQCFDGADCEARTSRL